MVQDEFVNGLIRVAWSCGGGNDGIGARLGAFLPCVVEANSELLKLGSDESLDAEWRSSQHVHAITDFYRDFLLEVFQTYANPKGVPCRWLPRRRRPRTSG